MDSTELLAGLIEALLVSSAAIALVLVLRGPLRRRFGAGVAYASWALVPAACVAMLLPAPVKEMPLLVTPVALTISALQVGTVATSHDLTPLWLGLWLAGVAAMAGRLWVQQRRFEHGLGSLQAVDAGARVLRAQSCAGLPALVGLLRPRIVLPADHATRYDSEQRALLLAHERVHLRRGDAWINALVAAVRALFWCNPLVYLAAGRLRHDQELACDERVIAARPRSRRAYADAMLNTLMWQQPVPLGCQWGLTHPIKERIMMLKQERPSRRVRLAGLALVGVAACASGFAVWAAQSPQVPSATPAAKEVAITMDGKMVNMREMVSILAREHGMAVRGLELIPANQQVSFGLKGVPLETVLALLGEEARLDARTTGREIVFSRNAGNSDAVPISASSPAVKATTPITQQATVDASSRIANPPAYPNDLAKQGIGGMVVLIVDVAADGRVTGTKVDRSSGDERLDSAAQAAATSWKFNPQIINGKAVAGQVRVPIEFKTGGDLGDAVLMDGVIKTKVGDSRLRNSIVSRANTWSSYDKMVHSFGASWQEPASVDEC